MRIIHFAVAAVLMGLLVMAAKKTVEASIDEPAVYVPDNVAMIPLAPLARAA
jgi:hypothetical protein